VQLAMGSEVLLNREMAPVGCAPDEMLSWIGNPPFFHCCEK